MQNRLASITRLELIAAARAHGKVQRDGPDGSTTPREDGNHGHAWVSPAAVHLVYRDAANAPTERIVVLRSIWQGEAYVRFVGVCLLRDCQREFRSDRVAELTCLATGEAPPDPGAWLAAHAMFDDDASIDITRRGFYSARDEVTVLAFLARADGVLDPDEVEAIVDLVMEAAPPGPFDRVRAARRIARLAPDAEALEKAAARISAHPERFERLCRAARRTLDADRRCDWQEQQAMAAIFAAAKRASEKRMSDWERRAASGGASSECARARYEAEEGFDAHR